MLEAATRGVLCKKLILEISQNSQENTCGRVSFYIKLQACNFLKKRLWHRYFPVNFVEFLRTPFLHNTTGQLLPKRFYIDIYINVFNKDIFTLYL